MRAGLVICAALLAASCGKEELSPIEQARQDEADVAAVNAAQVPPPVPIEPETIGMPDIEKYDMFGAGCSFAPGKGIAAVALLQPERGFMKIDGGVVRFAPDAGSGDLPLGAKGKYTGGAYSFVLDLASEEGTQSGYETVNFPARLVLRNDRDQVVYQADGTAQCGS
ncbi:hypothetical protein [Parafrankia sp. BMG5.11]|uniref:hypothetical protein n=1 Tax=Parafrankia sp. BMG5.11 TaxID=222540 RepID=UPI00103EEDD7|nr:hypothetical protein [Parafrankia sp. BMG5.11]TCJ37405.1 hypothetical protein E0504_20445 [Parafrankia sp. BMG5.11]